MERELCYEVEVNPPDRVKNNPNIILHFNIEKISIRNISTGHEKYIYSDTLIEYNFQDNVREIINFTQPRSMYYIRLRRKVSLADVNSQSLDQMPGFRFSWYYSGMEEVKPESRYKDDMATQAFVR